MIKKVSESKETSIPLPRHIRYQNRPIYIFIYILHLFKTIISIQLLDDQKYMNEKLQCPYLDIKDSKIGHKTFKTAKRSTCQNIGVNIYAIPY